MRILLLMLACASAAQAEESPSFRARVERDLRAPWQGDGRWILAAGTVGAGLSLRVEDAPTSQHALDSSSFDGALDVGNEFGSGWVLGGLALGSWGLGRWGERPGLSEFGADLGSSLVAVSAYTWTLKLAADRRRPNGGPHSFPSGHSAAAFAAAAVIDRHSGPWISLLGYALASSTMGGRMEENRHHLSDVLFGAALGLSVGGAQLPRVERGWLREHFTVMRGCLAYRTSF